MTELEQILLIRHGQTDHNRQRRFCGVTDVPLNEHGRREAMAVAGRLAGKGFAALVASPLQRARQTADAIAAAVGLEVREDLRLMELDHGEIEGLLFNEVKQARPEVVEEFISGKGEVPLPGGESLVDVQARAYGVLQDLLAEPPGPKVLVVTHQMVLASLLCRVLRLELKQWWRLRFDRASITVLERAHDDWAVRRINDGAHLEELGED